MTALNDRIDRLLRQRGGPGPPRETVTAAARGKEATADPLQGLGERIARLNRTRERGRPPDTDPSPGRRSFGDESDLAEQLGGRRIAPGVILTEGHVPYGHRHGEASIEAIAEDPAHGIRAPLVFIDTETTGLAGGTGTAVFLLGLARPTENGLGLRQYVITAFSAESAMLRQAAEFLPPTGTLVSFNGKSFDLPLLQARYRLSRLPAPFAGLGHLDLLHPLRSAYGQKWPDCRLQTAERHLLGLRRRGDLPGSQAPLAWLRWLRHRDGGQLPLVARHNRLDVISLAALLPRVGRIFHDPVAWAADIGAVARARLRGGEATSAYHLLEQNKTGLPDDELKLLARLARRRGNWRLATGIWRRLAERDDLDALECLAKYNEHQCRDPHAALELTRRLMGKAGPLPLLLHRARRLETKLVVRGG